MGQNAFVLSSVPSPPPNAMLCHRLYHRSGTTVYGQRAEAFVQQSLHICISNTKHPSPPCSLHKEFENFAACWLVRNSLWRIWVPRKCQGYSKQTDY